MIKGTVDVLDRWLESRFEGMHTCLPAKVESYDFATRKATVLPLVNLRMSSGAILEMPSISGVPVMLPSAAGWSLVGPIASGDSGIILISEASIGAWLDGQGQQVDPEDETRFSLQDAIFLPGLWPYSAVPSQPGTENDLALSTPKGSVIIKEDGSIGLTAQGKVSVKNNVGSLKTLVDDLWTEATGLTTDLQAQFTALASAASPDPLTPLAAAFTAAASAMTARLATITAKAQQVQLLLEE